MLAVRHARGRVGTLRPADGELAFAYHAEWLARADAFALTPRLPLREAPWQGREVAVFFANLLPEGALLDALLRMQRLPRGNLVRQLEAFGRESAGAFEIVREPEADASRTTPEPGWLPYPRADLVEDLARLRDRVPLLARHGELRLSLAGAQDKIPVRWADGALWLPQGDAASTHILKPALQPEREFPDAVANETFCLKLAGAIGLRVPAVTLLTDPEPLLLIERYDRVVSAAGIERMHQLDACQLCGVLPQDKYEVDGGPGFADCFGMLDRHSALPAADRLRLVDWLLFNALVGNADAHGKNIAMLQAADGSLALAPAYDLLATGYWPTLDDTMAMAIGGERRPRWVQARHWQRLCEDVRLNPVQLRRRAAALGEAAVQHAPRIAADLAVSAKLRRHLTETLEHHSERLVQRIGASDR